MALQVRSGVIAATLALSSGRDTLNLSQGVLPLPNLPRENAILFGASDLLVMARTSTGFDEADALLSETGRSPNWYSAVSLGRVHGDDRPRTFRALSFLRFNRPQYERLTLPQLSALFRELQRISELLNVTCEVLLAYGWADVYLDIRSDSLRDLFSAVTQYRAAELDEGKALLRNGFTIVGVDLRKREEASRHTELVRPTVTLRVSPSALADVLDRIVPDCFDDVPVRADVTTGKRDVLITPNDSLPFHKFWSIHQKLIDLLDTPGFPIQKVETHFQFSRTELSIPTRRYAPHERCPCAVQGERHAERFKHAIAASDEMGGLKRSFEGLAQLYVDALKDADSCCDFDAAAGHYFSQYRLLDHYRELIRQVQDTPGDLRLERRLNLYREALERLDISSLFIFHQEQNGSYVDLVTRSERVSLFRGGLQKINAVLLSAIQTIIDEHQLPIMPMLCWWPAGHIQSERPIGVIKVPISYLYEPETALLLIIHELGQLTAYERFESLDREPQELQSNVLPFDLDGLKRILWRRKAVKAKSSGLARELGSTKRRRKLVEALEDKLRAEGTLMMDIVADAFLLRVGFADDLQAMREFLFKQFLASEYSRAPRTETGFRYCVHIAARLMCMIIAARAFGPPKRSDREDHSASVLFGGDFEMNDSDLGFAREATEEFLEAVADATEYGMGSQRPGLSDVLRSSDTLNEAVRKITFAKSDMKGLLESFMGMTPRMVDPSGLEQVFDEGILTDINAQDMVGSFCELFFRASDSEDRSAVFIARSALIASALASLPPRRRLVAAP